MKTSQLLGTDAVAERLQLTGRRVLQLAKAGDLKAIIFGKGRHIFRSEDVEQLARERARRVGVR